MTKNSSFMNYKVDLLTRMYELVWLPLNVNVIIYGRYVLQGHLEKEF